MDASIATPLAALVAGLATSSTLFVKAEKSAQLAEERREDAVANEQRALAEKERADRAAEVARHNEELAEERRAEAEAARVRVLRLSDVKRSFLSELPAMAETAARKRSGGLRVVSDGGDSGGGGGTAVAEAPVAAGKAMATLVAS